jgi:SAM-dependent methyltransferase
MPTDLKSAIGWMYDYIKPNSDFLDIGCSTGYFGSLIKTAKTNRVYGVEISDDANQARKVLDGVYSFDLDGDWPKEVYEREDDYVFFGDVLEHLKDPEAVLIKCLKLLKKDGKVFVSTPNIAHISVRLELMAGNFEYEPMGILDTTHLKYFTHHSFSLIAERAGYKIEKIDYSLNDYPRDVILNLLNKVGLKPTNKFWELTETIEARAYQLKFILTPISDSEKRLSLNNDVIKKPEQLRDAYTDDLKEQVSNLRMHSDEQAKIIAHLSNELTSVYNSKSWKLAHRLSRIKKRSHL